MFAKKIRFSRGDVYFIRKSIYEFSDTFSDTLRYQLMVNDFVLISVTLFR